MLQTRHFFFFWYGGVLPTYQEVEEMRTWVNERMEKEEKKRLADEARERRQLALEAAPRRRSGRLVVSAAARVRTQPFDIRGSRLLHVLLHSIPVEEDTGPTLSAIFSKKEWTAM